MKELTKEEIKVIKAMDGVVVFEEISRRTGISKKRLSDVIDSLEEKGIIHEVAQSHFD